MPKIASFWIPGQLPGMNDMTAKRGRGRGFAYADAKQKWTNDIAMLARSARVPHFDRVHITYRWVEPNRKRDPDNIAAGHKHINDGLVLAKVLDNDGWKQISGWTDIFEVGPQPGVEITITEVPCSPSR